MSSWVRLWHDMPTDPKWRVIARRSGQRVGDVIAVFNFLMVSASANADERGRTHGFECEDVAAALDLECADVEAIITAMTGKVLDDNGWLTGWEKRQPKREDGAADRARAWRNERKRTQANASERPETDAETDADINAYAFISASEDFQEALSAYPKSGLGVTNTPAARAAWPVAAKAIGGAEKLLKAVKAYASSPDLAKRDHGAPGFHKWLSEERWRTFANAPQSRGFSPELLAARAAMLKEA